MLIDTHAHLASQQFSGDLPEVVKNATEAGVTRIISIGTDLEDSQRNIEIAEQFDQVYATVGIHPTSVHEVESDDWLSDIREWTAHPKVLAIGEIGLDYFHPPRDGSSPAAWRELQIRFFRAQLDLATELKLPVIIHQRDKNGIHDCRNDLLEIISDYQGKIRAVFHCFIGPLEQAQPFLDQGHLVSFTGIATFSSAKELQQTTQDIKTGQFMLETDSPYLAPSPFRGKRCEPAYTRLTAEHIAKGRDISLEELARQTSATAEDFFGLPAM
ncbi:MAG: TatD family hydrolase [Verrucomicrobiales bacterium]|nr:TatD family hydrolase [Verrucomicrobiales bacterium]